MSNPRHQAGNEVVRASRALSALGLVTAFGHVSQRAGSVMLITPAADLGCVIQAELVEVNLSTASLPQGAPAEAWAHLAVYGARPDVQAIARAQPPAAFAAAAALSGEVLSGGAAPGQALSGEALASTRSSGPVPRVASTRSSGPVPPVASTRSSAPVPRVASTRSSGPVRPADGSRQGSALPPVASSAQGSVPPPAGGSAQGSVRPAAVPVLPLLHGQACWLGERVPVHQDARLLRSAELAAAAAATLGLSDGLLLRGNGALTCGASPGLAVARMWLLAAACETWLTAAACGTPRPMGLAEAESWRAVASELLPRLWLHLSRTAGDNDAKRDGG